MYSTLPTSVPKKLKKYSRRNIWSVLQCNGHPLVLYLIVLYECKFTHIPGRNPGKLSVVLWWHTPAIPTLWRQKRIVKGSRAI